MVASVKKASLSLINFLIDKAPNPKFALSNVFTTAIKAGASFERALYLRDFRPPNSVSWLGGLFFRGSRSVIERFVVEFFPGRPLRELLREAYRQIVRLDPADPDAVLFLLWLFEESGQEHFAVSDRLVSQAITAGNRSLVEFLLGPALLASGSQLASPMTILSRYRPEGSNISNPALDVFLAHPNVKEKLREELRHASSPTLRRTFPPSRPPPISAPRTTSRPRSWMRWR